MNGLVQTHHDEKIARKTWEYHKSLVGVAGLQGAYYLHSDESWTNQYEINIEGAEYIRTAYEQGKGVLVMTYHHHFNISFCSLLGRLGLPISTIAMDARDTDQFKNFGSRIERIYAQVEKHFNGGDIILVKPNNPVRPIMRAFDKKHLVVTANDFPDVFDDKNRKNFDFLNMQLSCPTGTVKFAVKKRIPVVASYLDWKGGKRFTLVIKPISDGIQSVKVKDVMTRYLGVLENLVQNNPGLWEGWKWLG